MYRFGSVAWLGNGSVSECASRCVLASQPEQADVLLYNLAVRLGTVKPRAGQVHTKRNLSVLKRDLPVLKRGLSVLKRDLSVLKRDLSVYCESDVE